MSRAATLKAPAPTMNKLDLSELTIDFSLHGYVIWKSTRVQLEAEGLVPIGETWPRGFDSARWTTDGWDFTLSRERPDGAEGPRKAFEAVDNWRLLRRPVGGDPFVNVKVRELRRELARAEFAASEAGRIRCLIDCELAMSARSDRAFQEALVAMLQPCSRLR